MKKQCCRNCVYAVPLRAGRQTLWVCTNQAQRPGELTAVSGADCCARFWRKWSPPVRRTPPKSKDPSIRYVALTQGKFAIVDAEDYERVNRHKWCVSGKGNTIYAYRKDHGKHVYLHQFLMKPPPGMVVDHIDGNGLNDRKSNLRVCTRQQNLLNRGPSVRSSRYKGVRFCKWNRKWYATIRYDGHTIRLGPFDDEIAAAQAYDRQAYALFGEYAYLNFPEEVRGRTVTSDK
jgi:hypothetical protein